MRDLLMGAVIPLPVPVTPGQGLPMVTGYLWGFGAMFAWFGLYLGWPRSGRRLRPVGWLIVVPLVLVGATLIYFGVVVLRMWT